MLAQAFGRMRRARVGSLLLVLLYAVVTVLLPPVGPVYGGGSHWAEGGRLLAGILVETGIVYRLVADMRERPARMAELPWFYAGGLLAMLPLGLITIGALAPLGLTNGTAVTALFVGLFAGYGCIMLLQAWPVAMAARRGWVSPLRMLRAARGHRRHLLFATIVLGGLNSLPGADPMDPIGQRLLMIALQLAAMTLQTLFLAGLAAAAYDAACANDPGLREAARPR